MALRYALLIDPVAVDDIGTDFSATFTAADPAAPALGLGELSAQRGDGVFESIQVVGGHVQELQPHLDRLAHSARICDLPAPHPGQWRQAVTRVAAHCGAGESVIKLILSRGVEHGPTPTAWVTAADVPDFTAARTEGIAVVTLDRGYDSAVPARAPWLLLGAKTLSYAVNMAALREAKRRGADDALFVTTDGFVLEAPTATLIVKLDGAYVTPAPTGGILQGTTQGSAFAWLEAQGLPTSSRDVRTAELARAEAAWLISSLRLAAPITAIDGIPVARDVDLTARLNAHLLSPRD